MEVSPDAAGFKDAYGIETAYVESGVVTGETRELMSGSYWYADADDYRGDAFAEMLDEIDGEARAFVAGHRQLLNRMSDESFLEAMALDIACMHNRVFRIGNADAVEIFDIDTTDILRMSVLPADRVVDQCSKSFAGFIYDNGGVLGTVAMVFLLFIHVAGSVLKPACLAVMTACLFVSVVARQLVRKAHASALEGYLATMAAMCLCNVMFSLLFKASLHLPGLGMGVAASALLQIVMQGLYIYALGMLTMAVAKDWRNAGYGTYRLAARRVMADIRGGRLRAWKQDEHAGRQAVRSRHASITGRHKDLPAGDNGYSAPGDYGSINGWEILDSMRANDAERSRHARRK